MTSRRLTSQNATITTVEVKLSTLTVSGKQVTLAVFRQLPEEPLIAQDGTLNGVPWGYVNYHPDKCADNATHWHVVWQRGEELLRSAVEKRPHLDGQRWENIHECDGCFESDEADQFINAAVREWVNGRVFAEGPLENVGDRTANPQHFSVVHWVVDGVTVHAEPSAAARAMRATWANAHIHYWRKSAEEPLGRSDIAYLAPAAPWDSESRRKLPTVLGAAIDAGVIVQLKIGGELPIRTTRENHEVAMAVRELESEVTEVLEKVRGSRHLSLERAQREVDEGRAALDAELEATGLTFGEINQGLKDAVREERARRQRHLDARKAIADLPQLYIAV